MSPEKEAMQAAESLRRILREHDEVRAEVERAYRRGFHQAAYLAAEAAREGFSAEEFKRWASRLLDWRYSQSGAEVVCPLEPWEVR